MHTFIVITTGSLSDMACPMPFSSFKGGVYACIAQLSLMEKISIICLFSQYTCVGSHILKPYPRRYHIGDNGGLLSFHDMFRLLEKEGFDTAACLSADYTVRRQPFCWVFGRAHWAVSLFGANVFVDQVMGERMWYYVCACVLSICVCVSVVLVHLFGCVCFYECMPFNTWRHKTSMCTYVFSYLPACTLDTLTQGVRVHHLTTTARYILEQNPRITMGLYVGKQEDQRERSWQGATIPTYIHTYIHTCIHTYMHTYTHTHIHKYTLIHGGSWRRARMCTFIRHWKIHTVW